MATSIEMRKEFKGLRSRAHAWELQPQHPERGERAHSSHRSLSGLLLSQLGNGIGALPALSFCDSMMFLPNPTFLSGLKNMAKLKRVLPATRRLLSSSIFLLSLLLPLPSPPPP